MYRHDNSLIYMYISCGIKYITTQLYTYFKYVPMRVNAYTWRPKGVLTKCKIDLREGRMESLSMKIGEGQTFVNESN